MGLVDYSSDTDTNEGPASPKETSLSSEPPQKKKKLSPSEGFKESRPSVSSISLPPAFHDLYASSVRTFDDPSLHHGRRRQTPHITGHWPSHVYIEWRPPEATYATLGKFISRLRERLCSYPIFDGDQGLRRDADDPPVGERGHDLHSLLTSDLGVPQPLHISLSRPLSLPTATKDDFLRQVEAGISRGKVAPFELRCRGVEWHHTAESGRSFLVLRVGNDIESGGSDDDSGHPGSLLTDHSIHLNRAEWADNTSSKNPNLELTALLSVCNMTAEAFDQPKLYQSAENGDRAGKGVGDAFHMSIGWSFVEPTEEIRKETSAVFDEDAYGGSLRGTKVAIDSVKVKIGNIVKTVSLPEQGVSGKRQHHSDHLGSQASEQ